MIFCVFLCNAYCFAVQADEAVQPFRIVGYLPEYRFSRLNSEHAGLLTDLILFAAEPSAAGDVMLGKLKDAPWQQLWDIRKKSGTKLILCLGGWGKSDNFSRAVTNETSRGQLVKSIEQLLLEHRLDGLDIDWEYPQSPEEWDGYISLLVQLKAAFRPHGLLLTMTVAPWRELPEQAWQAVDGIQLMSYDYGQRHSTPQQAQKDVQSFLDRGIPARKLVLGMPFYGRNIEDRKTMTYSRIVDRFQPVAENDEVSGYYFNGPVTIQRKTQSALDSGIGGVMVWEIGQDLTGERSLLRKISETVGQAKKK